MPKMVRLNHLLKTHAVKLKHITKIENIFCYNLKSDSFLPQILEIGCFSQAELKVWQIKINCLAAYITRCICFNEICVNAISILHNFFCSAYYGIVFLVSMLKEILIFYLLVCRNGSEILLLI